MLLGLTTRIATPSHVLTRRLDDELVLLNLDSECYFGLDEISTSIWEVLSSAPSIDAGIEALLGTYDVEPDRLRADIEVFLSELVAHGLVEYQRV